MSSFGPMLGRYTPKEKTTDDEGTILSVRHMFRGPVRREDAEEKLRGIFRELSPDAMVDHVVLGHFKGAIRCDEAVFAISVTREDVLDETANQAWNDLTILPEGEVTVNLLSVIPVPVTKEKLEKLLNIPF